MDPILKEEKVLADNGFIFEVKNQIHALTNAGWMVAMSNFALLNAALITIPVIIQSTHHQVPWQKKESIKWIET